MKPDPMEFFDRDNIDSMEGIRNEDHLSLKELLMKVIMGDTDLSEICLAFIDDGILFKNEKTANSDLWKVFYFTISYRVEYDASPSDEIVYSDLKESRSSSVMQKRLIEKLLGANDVKDVDWAKQQLFFRIENVYKTKVTYVAALGKEVNFAELISVEKEAFEKQVARLLKSSFVLTNAFDSILGQIVTHVKSSTGIPWIDGMLGGGLSPGEQALFIVPSGGGKSTLAWQFVSGLVDQNKKSLYCSFEQELDGDFALRTRVLATQMGRAIWSRDAEDIPAIAIKRAKEAAPSWKEHHRYSYLGNPREKMPNAQAFIEFLETVHKDFPFEYVMVDWIGLFTLKMLRDSGRKTDTFNIKYANAEIVDAVAKFNREYGTKAIFFQQRGGGVNKAGGKPTQNDAAGDADLDQLFDYAFTATTRSEDGSFKIINGKSRSAANTYKILRLNGEMCRIEPADSIIDSDIPGNEPNRGHYRSKFPEKPKSVIPATPMAFASLNKGI